MTDESKALGAESSGQHPPTAEPGVPVWGYITPRYANICVIVSGPGIVRLSFGESFGSPQPSVFHTAIALLPQDAITIAKGILDTIGQSPARAKEPKDGS